MNQVPASYVLMFYFWIEMKNEKEIYIWFMYEPL